MGGETDDGGRGRGWRRVKPVVNACPPRCTRGIVREIIILFPKNPIFFFLNKVAFPIQGNTQTLENHVIAKINK